MATGAKPITYQEYFEGPETKVRQEVVDGEVILLTPPFNYNQLYHQTIIGNIFYPVWLFVKERGLGEALFAPFDIVVQREPLRVRQPNIEFTSNERAGILGDWIEGGPDLLVEIISPNNNRSYIESKLADYALINVLEIWVLSPEAHNIEVLRLEGGQWRRAYIRGVGERLESVVLPGLALDIADIFQGT